MRASFVTAFSTVFITCLFSVFMPLQVDAKDLYTIDNVQIGASGVNATEARYKAIESGQLKGFYQLVKKLASAPVAENTPALDPVTLSRIVRGFEVSNEKIASNRYQAVLSVSFNAGMVKSLLGKSGIAYSESNALRTLIIPVYKEKNNVILWETGNLWRDKISAALRSAGGNRILLPMGDLEDMAMLDKAGIDALDSAKLVPLAAKYGVDKIIVVTASINEITNSLQMVQTLFIDGQAPKTTNHDFVMETGQDVASLFDRGVKELLPATKLAPAATAAATASPAATASNASLDLAIPFTDLKEWTSIRTTLEQISIVQKVTVKQLSVNKVDVRVDYAGTTAALTEQLTRQGLSLQKKGNNAMLTRSSQ